MAPRPPKNTTENDLPDADRADADQLATPAAIESPDSAPAGGPGAPAAGVAASGGAGAITVDVNSNLSLAGGQILQVGQKGVKVADTAEVRACIAAGYLVESGADK